MARTVRPAVVLLAIAAVAHAGEPVKAPADHWAFKPPQSPPLPVGEGVGGRGLRSNPIDAFVRGKLAEHKLTLAAPADKPTLLRRVTFDLTGLPPTVVEIDRFLKDDSPLAYSRLVDRLLADKAYGEHMARYWADLVRLADTNGMHKDFYRNFSTYRSWLIRAFNNNLKFDD
ncbi:MAG: DUF1549 domain-containing protein, partial [Gemmataceae bacterium]